MLLASKKKEHVPTLIFLIPFVSMQMGVRHRDVHVNTFVLVHLQLNCLGLITRSNMLGVGSTTKKQIDLLLVVPPSENFF